jgi:hypothetical protein
MCQLNFQPKEQGSGMSEEAAINYNLINIQSHCIIPQNVRKISKSLSRHEKYQLNNAVNKCQLETAIKLELPEI